MDLFVTNSETAVVDALKAYPKIPAATIKALHRYVVDKIPTGGFLNAILTNNLLESCARADEWNKAALFDILSFCYNEIPSPCWKSKQAVQEWLKK